MNLIQTFVQNPVKVTVGVILIVLFGVLSMATMPMQLTPEVQIPTLSIETIWPGASPQEVEREIVQEQEEQLKGVEGVNKMTSQSMDSQGTITLEFPVGTDMSEALVKVNTRLQQVPSYPENVDQPVIKSSNSSDRPIAWFILSQKPPSSDDIRAFAKSHPEVAELLSRAAGTENEGLRMLRLKTLAKEQPVVQKLLPPEIDISTYRRFAEDFVEARFERVSGVSNSNVLGGREDEVQVVVDPERLAARQLTINDVRQALRGQNKDTSAGDFWEGKRRYVVRTLGQFRTIEQVSSVIVARRNNVPVYVRDVADVKLTHKKPDGFVKRFGETCIAINAERAIGWNVLAVMDGLRTAGKELNDTILKNQGLHLTQVYDETEYIYSARNLVVDNLLEGAVLTFITLLLFLRSARSTIVVFIHILVSTIGAFLVMKLLGRSLNVPALGGLAFAVGMLVDNAIVMLENIYRRFQKGESAMQASVNGAGEVWGALFNATLANLAVFVPVLFVQEEAGQLFRDIAIAISAAVALSMLVAVTVVPTSAMRLLASEGDTSRSQRWRRLFPAPLLAVWDVAVGLLQRFVLHPLDTLGTWFVNLMVNINAQLQRRPVDRLVVVVGFLVGSVFLTWIMIPKVEYLPNGNRNLVFGILLPPPGYNLNQLGSMGDLVERRLRPYWDVDPGDPQAKELKFPPIGDFFYVARSRQVFLGLKAQDPARAAELVPLLRSLASELPGTFVWASQASLFEQGLTGGRNIDIEITGPELLETPAPGAPAGPPRGIIPLAQAVMGRVAKELPKAQMIPKPSLDLSNPEVHVVPKWEQMADMQLSATDLGYAVDALVDGAYATDFYLGADKIDLRIVGQERFAKQTQDLQSLPIATPTGELVPLAAVADVELRSGPEQINHRTRQRTITVQVNPPPDQPLEAAMDILNEKVVNEMQRGGELPEGYQIFLAGTADKLRATWSALRSNILLAILITYLLMAATFESWLYPFVVMLTVPIGAVGGFAGLYLLNQAGYLQPLDVLTMLGFVMLVGTVVNNPILIVEQSLVHMREEGMALDEAILNSVRYRIRPIFMTTLGGLAGLLPLVLAPGAGSELYRGIGAVLLGGLLLSTAVTLVFVPAALSLLVEAQATLARRWRGEGRVTDVRTVSVPALTDSEVGTGDEPSGEDEVGTETLAPVPVGPQGV